MKIRNLVPTLLLLLLTSAVLSAQNVNLSPAAGSSLTIDGTSNVTDWSADATSIEAEFVLNGFSGEIGQLRPGHFRALTLRIPVEGIESDGGRMTRNIHDYLKAKEHPVITFELKKVNSIEPDGDRATIHADGVITAAGVSLPVTLELEAEKSGTDTLLFSGSHHLRMTDFDIKPPRAMLGTIRAADEITVSYNVAFSSEQLTSR